MSERSRKRNLSERAKESHKRSVKKWRKANPDYVKMDRATWGKAWKEKNPDRLRAYRRRYRLKIRYGLTPETRAELFEESDGLCAVCYERVATEVDHDHDTGRVRGAVCHQCNVTLPRTADELGEWVQNVAAYFVWGRREAG